MSSPLAETAALLSELERRIEAFEQGEALGDNMGDSGPAVRSLIFWLLISMGSWAGVQFLAWLA